VIPLGRDRRLRVLGVRDDDADKPPVLVVEACPERPLVTFPSGGRVGGQAALNLTKDWLDSV
jgi:hypothetical protein